MPDNEFKEERVVYGAPTYTLGQLLDEPETIPGDIRQEMVENLRKLLDDGLKSGVAETFDFDDFIARKRSEHSKAK
ncbi:MAG: hypothetical protein RL367_947 [Pseudomonadota bacterium]|jgi:hypothetical protein